MKVKIVLLYVIFCALVVVNSACQSQQMFQAAAETDQYSVDPGEDPHDINMIYPRAMPSAVRGESIFAETCLACHGKQGTDGVLVFEGSSPDFRNPEFFRQKLPSELFKMVWYGEDRNGVAGKHPTFEKAFSDIDPKLKQFRQELQNQLTSQIDELTQSGNPDQEKLNLAKKRLNEFNAQQRLNVRDVWDAIFYAWDLSVQYPDNISVIPTTPVRQAKLNIESIESQPNQTNQNSPDIVKHPEIDSSKIIAKEPLAKTEPKEKLQPKQELTLNAPDLTSLVPHTQRITGTKVYDRNKDLFGRNCTVCHGDTGHGNGFLHDKRVLNPQPQKFADRYVMSQFTNEYIAWRIRKGAEFSPNKMPESIVKTMPLIKSHANNWSAMPPWEQEFSDEELWNLVNHIRSYTYEHK